MIILKEIYSMLSLHFVLELFLNKLLSTKRENVEWLNLSHWKALICIISKNGSVQYIITLNGWVLFEGQESRIGKRCERLNKTTDLK